MDTFGIEAISCYVPNYYLDLKILAKARGVSANKYYLGLGQELMAVPAPGEDIVTMAANATAQLLQNTDIGVIDTLMFATESGFDYSKAAGIYVHKLLQLPSRCRVIELKQACYSSTAGLQMAMAMLRCNPQRKILLIASDIARYGFNTPGEASQGAGAVAMLLSANPKLLAIEEPASFYTEDAMDFWRPDYCDEAVVDGKYSCELYLRVLQRVWEGYSRESGRKFSDHDLFCYHVPICKLVAKAHRFLAELNGVKDFSLDMAKEAMAKALLYNKIIGNCYTASLYISLLSLLENSAADLAEKRIGFYSYGSGCGGEFFSIKVMPEYSDNLITSYHQNLIANREALSYDQYSEFYNFSLPEDGSNFTIPEYKTGKFRLTAVGNHKRVYERTV